MRRPSTPVYPTPGGLPIAAAEEIVTSSGERPKRSWNPLDRSRVVGHPELNDQSRRGRHEKSDPRPAGRGGADAVLGARLHGTGIAQILKEADAGSGSLYYFFPTKEDLLLAVLEWYRENLGPAVVEPVFDRVSDPIERIFGILDGYRQGLLATGFSRGCPIGNLALELADSHPAARELLAANFTGWRKAIEQCLAEAGPAARFARSRGAGAVRAHHDGRRGDAGPLVPEHRALRRGRHPAPRLLRSPAPRRDRLVGARPSASIIADRSDLNPIQIQPNRKSRSRSKPGSSS